jgi:multidrug transporter EmrE-like cation transporter
MKSVEILFLLITVFTGSIGQFFLKNGAKQLGSVNVNNVLTQVVGIATNFNLVVGLIFYAVAAVLYILMLTRVPLSVLAPAVSLQYVLSMLMGKYFFGEVISFNRLVGLSMIVAGVILVIWEK